MSQIILTKQEAATLASYIDQLESICQRLTGAATDLLCEDGPDGKRILISVLMDSPEVWEARQPDLLDKLFPTED